MKRILILSSFLSLLGCSAQAQSIKDVDCKAFSKLITNPDIQPVHHKYLIVGEAVGNAFSDGKQLK